MQTFLTQLVASSSETGSAEMPPRRRADCCACDGRGDRSSVSSGETACCLASCACSCTNTTLVSTIASLETLLYQQDYLETLQAFEPISNFRIYWQGSHFTNEGSNTLRLFSGVLCVQSCYINIEVSHQRCGGWWGRGKTGCCTTRKKGNSKGTFSSSNNKAKLVHLKHQTFLNIKTNNVNIPQCSLHKNMVL